MMKMDSNFVFIPLPKEKYTFIKDTLNGVWSAKHGSWRFPKSVLALDEIAKYFPELSETQMFQDIYLKLKDGRETLRNYKMQEIMQDDDDILRIYQRQDVEYLKKIPSGGVFNEPRTGKTPTMIHVIKELKTVHNLIISPASLVYNWRNEIQKFHPEAETFVVNGSPQVRKKIYTTFQESRTPTYLIVSKDTVKRDVEDLTFAYDTCIVDEAHYLRNIETTQTTAIYTISYNAKRRYALTGTPTVKHPSDIYGLLKYLYPYKFTSKWQFYERYFHLDDNGFGKMVGKPKEHRVKELQDLLDAMSTQRLRKDVMPWLPDKEYITHTCHMETKQQKLYQSMLEDFFAQDGDTVIDTQNVLAQLMRLRQITLDPELIGLNAPSAKTDALIETVDNNTYGEPIIIMSVFTSYLHKLKKIFVDMGKKVEMIIGETPKHIRDENVKAFQRGDVDILLCNIQAAGTGLTLDKGEIVIFTDKAWNPADNQQAEDRVCPTSQDKIHKHTVISFVCEGSIDAKIEAILNRKENLTAIVNQCKTYADLKKFLFTLTM